MPRMYARAPIGSLLLLVSVASSVSAQFTVRAITRTGLTAWTDRSSQSVPANTDITAGSSVSTSYFTGGASAAASTNFTVASVPPGIGVTLEDRGSAMGGSSPFYAMAGVGPQFGGGPQTIDVELSSSPARNVRLLVSACTDGGGYGGTLAIAGLGSVSPSFTCLQPTQRIFDLVIDATPTVLVFSTSGYSVGARGGTSFHGRWTVTITNRAPCDGLQYDTPCGASLSSYGTLALPGTWLELVDSSLPTAALLLVGTQSTRVPIGLCFLYTDFPMILPFGLTAPDRAAVYLPPLPFPVQVTTQGLTLGPAGFHASNGLMLQCR